MCFLETVQRVGGRRQRRVGRFRNGGGGAAAATGDRHRVLGGTAGRLRLGRATPAALLPPPRLPRAGPVGESRPLPFFFFSRSGRKIDSVDPFAASEGLFFLESNLQPLGAPCPCG